MTHYITCFVHCNSGIENVTKGNFVSGHFVPEDVLLPRIFYLGTFCPEDVSQGLFIPEDILSGYRLLCYVCALYILFNEQYPRTVTK
jgi:hypothetical protein